MVFRLADYFTRWVKVLLILICILATGVFTWFSLIVDGVLPSSVGEWYHTVYGLVTV